MDGYPEIFDIVGPYVMQCIKEIWENHPKVSDLNKTCLVLIHKVPKPEFINQVRPIALCDTVYKCLTKVIVDRLKQTLRERISPHQASFVPRCKLHDNIIITKEMVHSKLRMRGKKKYIAIKIDLEKE